MTCDSWSAKYCSWEIGSRGSARIRAAGEHPEFDSMTVVTLIHALEQQFDIQVADDEISAESFGNLGKVHEFVRDKATARS